MLEKGSKAPLFIAQGVDKNQKEITYSLKDILNNNEFVVLYFYPKDDTPGCTIEAIDFSKDFSTIPNAAVFGLSKDDIASHIKFQQKYDIKIPLLVDTDLNIAKKFEATTDDSKLIRSTFLINKDGTIKKAWYSVNVKNHVKEVIEAMKDN